MHYLVLALISFGVAALGSLIGAGGGFLLMPVLLFLYAGTKHGDLVLGPRELTFISLCAVFINGLAASLNYARMKRIDYRTAVTLAVCCIPVVIAARRLLASVRGDRFSPLFGVILIAISAFIIWRVRRRGDASAHRVEPKPHWTRRHIEDVYEIEYDYAFDMRTGVGASLAGGFIGAFFGIGGGILHVPVMTQLLNFPAHIAAATSILILTMTAATGIVTDIASRGTNVPISLALAAGAGAFLGAQVGTRLSRRVSGERILYLLATVLILCGGKLVVEALMKKAPPLVEPPAQTDVLGEPPAVDGP